MSTAFRRESSRRRRGRVRRRATTNVTEPLSSLRNCSPPLSKPRSLSEALVGETPCDPRTFCSSRRSFDLRCPRTPRRLRQTLRCRESVSHRDHASQHPEHSGGPQSRATGPLRGRAPVSQEQRIDVRQLGRRIRCRTNSVHDDRGDHDLNHRLNVDHHHYIPPLPQARRPVRRPIDC